MNTELAQFVAKVQGTFDYKAEMEASMATYRLEIARKNEQDKNDAQAATEAAWAKFIKEHV